MKSFAAIDLDNLELEWLGQDQKVQEVAKAFAEAKFDLAELKAEEKVVESRIKMKIRANPSEYGIKSAANDPVAERMILFKSYKRIRRRINKAQLKVDLLKGALDTLADRREGLKDLVTLQGRSYFATPRMDKDTPRMVKQKIEFEDLKRSVNRKRKVV